MKNEAVQERIISEIKSVKIQGAENVAKAGIKAYLLNPTKSARKAILKARPTEPLLQNAIRLLKKSKTKNATAKKFIKELENSHDKIAKKGSVLIKNNMNVFSHCHSSTVIDILKYAKKVKKKNFTVYTTEVEPLLQGRKTAQELSKLKIKVVVAPDLAAEESLRKCDLFLFGADAFSKRFVANKIGTSTLCKLAKIYNIPRYSCGVSLKFTKKVKIEKRSAQEVWDEINENIFIENPAFDKTKYKLLTGIISEFGILPPKQFVKRAKENLKRLRS